MTRATTTLRAKATESGTTPASAQPAVPPGHRVPAHLARRFHQICLGVTGEMLKSDDLTPIEYTVLAALGDFPGQDQRALAARLGIDNASVSQIVERLEKASLILRRISPTDRRARMLFLTSVGTRLRRRLRPALMAAQQSILAPLSPDERDLLIALLARVVEGNETYAKPGNGRRKPKPKNVPVHAGGNHDNKNL